MEAFVCETRRHCAPTTGHRRELGLEMEALISICHKIISFGTDYWSM